MRWCALGCVGCVFFWGKTYRSWPGLRKLCSSDLIFFRLFMFQVPTKMVTLAKVRVEVWDSGANNERAGGTALPAPLLLDPTVSRDMPRWAGEACRGGRGHEGGGDAGKGGGRAAA